MKQGKYDGFISYSHADCGNIARAVQKGIENTGKPWYQIGRSLNIYRDETNLSASPHLWDSIENALADSDFFILLASPIAAASGWVADEVNYWTVNKADDNKKAQKIFIILASGEIEWDKEKNDFNWERTNSLPRILQGRFSEEPLWVDLRPYVDTSEKAHRINYQVPGFTAGLTKVIGGIKGKDPRDIESEELSRSRKVNTMLVISAVVFLSIIILAFSFFKQEKLARKNSYANALIAEANKYRNDDIDKALLLYANAYLYNNDTAVFNSMSDFVRMNCIIDSAFDSAKPDTLNAFYSLLYKADTAVLKNVAQTLYISLPAGKIFSIWNDTIHFVDLTQGWPVVKKSWKHAEGSPICSPWFTQVYFFTEGVDFKSDGEVLLQSVNLVTFERDTLLRYTGSGTGVRIFFRNKEVDMRKWVDQEYHPFSIYISPNEKFVAIYESFSSTMLDKPNEPETKIPIYLFNLAENSFTEIAVSIPAKNDNGNQHLTDLNISDDGKMLYLNYTSMADDLTNAHFIYDVGRQQLIKKMHEGDAAQSTTVSQPSAFAWGPGHKYYVAANRGGQLILSANPEDNYAAEMYSYFQNQGIGESTAVELSNNYFFTASVTGLIHIWRNPFSGEVLFGPFDFLEPIIEFSLPSKSSVKQIAYDSVSKKLYLINEAGEVYLVQLNKWINLSKDATELKKQVQQLELPGLNEADRKRLKIPLLTEK